MALRRGNWGKQTINSRISLGGGPKVFWLPGGTETTVVLLDDEPTECVRHQQYLKGDKKGNGMRVTCAGIDPVSDPDPVPQRCVICNAMLRADRIARKHLLYLTLIDERSFKTDDGTVYKDMKRLLELSPDQADLFRRRRESAGTLIGAKFKVYRSQQKNAARHGDDWTFVGFVWNREQGEPPQQGLMRHFWKSPAIPNIRKNAEQRKGPGGVQPMSWQEAAEALTKPYDYEDIMGKYDPKEAIAFVSYHAQAMGLGGLGTAQAGPAPGVSGEAPPFPGGTTAPDYSTAAPPTMPTDAAPAFPSGPSNPNPTGQEAPPWNPGQAPPTNMPPSVPDPVAAGGVGYGATAPAFPAFPGAAPTGNPNPPTYSPPMTGNPPGANYDFNTGQGAPQPQPGNMGASQAPAFPNQPGMVGSPSEPFGTA